MRREWKAFMIMIFVVLAAVGLFAWVIIPGTPERSPSKSADGSIAASAYFYSLRECKPFERGEGIGKWCRLRQHPTRAEIEQKIGPPDKVEGTKIVWEMWGSHDISAEFGSDGRLVALYMNPPPWDDKKIIDEWTSHRVP